MTLILALAAAFQTPSFPERAPGLMEDCLSAAAVSGDVTEEADEQARPALKYLCSGPPAEALWRFLERNRVAAWEQDTPREGRWLSRAFPMGGCFKRTRKPDGTAATDGLSCSIWIPRATPPQAQ